jgi:hypothetical protein
MAKKLKIKLPKRVAGVKIPKSVRKGPVGQFLNSGAGQILIAEALVAAAGTLAASRSDADSRDGDAVRHHPIDTTRRAGKRAANAGADQVARVSYALREAARAFRDAMEVGPTEAGLREETWQERSAGAEIQQAVTPAATNESAAKKKPASSRNEPPVPH